MKTERMKRTAFALVLNAILGLTGVTNSNAAAIAYNFDAGQAGNQAYGGSLGNDFTVNFPIVVTRLGVFDDLANGINGSLTATIYARDGNTGTPVPGAVATFTNANPGTLVGGVRLLEPATNIILQPGTYTIASSGHSASDQNLNSNVGGFPFQQDNAGGLITIELMKRFAGGGATTFPTSPDGNFLYGSGTFEYAIDESSIPVTDGIANHSFEAIPHTDHTPANGFPFSDVHAGWEAFGPEGVGEYNPSDIQYVGASDQMPDIDTTIPDGVNAAFVNEDGAGLRQLLGQVLEADEEIELSAWFGERLDTAGSSSYTMRLLANSIVLGSVSGSVTNGWVRDVVNVSVDENHPALGFNLVIEIEKTGGSQLNVDNVGVGVPEPASLSILALMGLTLIKRRK